MKPICVATLALSLACATPVAHALDNLRPGLWEFRSTRLSVAGLPDMSAQMGMLQQHIKGLPADTRRMLEQQMQQQHSIRSQTQVHGFPYLERIEPMSR